MFLNITGGNQFRATLDQMLPEHAGGTFRGLSQGARTLGRQALDPTGPIALSGKVRVSLGAATWGGSKATAKTQAYDNSGLGFSATAELVTGLGNFGASLSWLWNETKTGRQDNSVISNTYLMGAHWRGNWGAFSAYAQGGYGVINFESDRYFTGQTATKTIERTTTGKWNGKLATFSAGASAEGGGRHFFFRPSVQVDYVRVTEDAHTETGGGSGLNLAIDRRRSSELAAEGGLALGFDFTGTASRDSTWFRVEAEGGWREILNGRIGKTTARFGTGTAFTLSPEQGTNGWFGRLRALGGSSDFQLGGELGLEDTNERVGFSLRGTLRLPF